MSAFDSFTATATSTAPSADWGTPHSSWKVTLRNSRGNRYTVPFHMGTGLGHREPTAAEVLGSLVSDAEGYRNHDFEDFAANYGYPTEGYSDRRAALKVYNACKRISERLDTFLTAEEYDAILSEDA